MAQDNSPIPFSEISPSLLGLSFCVCDCSALMLLCVPQHMLCTSLVIIRLTSDDQSLSTVCSVLPCAHHMSPSHSATAAADTLIALEIFAYNFVEIKRWQDFKKPGSQSEKGSFVGLEGFFQGSGENGYPGGIFDPLGLSKCAPAHCLRDISDSLGLSKCTHASCLHGLGLARPWRGVELRHHGRRLPGL